MKLDLFSISDAEFEELCCDMMSVKFCEDTKHGRRGRDFGIDGVVAKNGGRIYMQAKHYKTDGYSALRSVVKKEEVEKSKKFINCTRYILMTSCELSVPQKDEILKLYGGIITSINDIWSGEDIRATLAQPEYQWVVRRHYNLWLSGVDALEQFIGDGNESKSEDLLVDIQDELKHTIRLDCFDAADEHLDKNKVIVITGQAGTGKTTLAKQLVVDYVFKKGYKLVASDFDVGVFEKQIGKREEEKTLFYLDDFLGANCLDVIANNRDSQIVNFIKRILRRENCRLVLTSRTNIIKEASNQSVKISESEIEKLTFQLEDAKIGRVDKARILYNQMFFGDVDKDSKTCVVENENFFKIIDHRNYNPRIISYCFSSRFVNDGLRTADRTGIERILWMLDNPSEIWRDCFTKLSSVELYLVCFVFLARVINLSDLESAYRRLLCRDAFAAFRNDTCVDALRKLNTSVLSAGTKVGAKPGNPAYQLFNPSVGDYIMQNNGRDDVLIADAVLLLESLPVVEDVCRGYLSCIKYRGDFEDVKLKAAERVLNELVRHTNKYSSNFVLEVHNRIVCWTDIGVKWKKALGREIGSRGIIYAERADPIQVSRFLHWAYDNDDESLNDDRINREFLDSLYVRIDKAHELAMLNRIYAYCDENRPVGYEEKIVKLSSAWAEEIAQNESWDDGDTADYVNEKVMNEIDSILCDCDLGDLAEHEDLCCNFDPGYYSLEESAEVSRDDVDYVWQWTRADENKKIRSIFEGAE